jgi:hypothetical protein
MPFEILVVEFAFLPLEIHDGIVVDTDAIQGILIDDCLVADLAFEPDSLDRDPSPVMGLTV